MRRKAMEIVRTIDDPELRPVLEYDLIALGVRLRWFLDEDDDRLNWEDMWAIVSAAPQTTQLKQAQYPEDAPWTPSLFMLAAILDELKWANWTKTKDGSKGKNPPEPIERPGIQSKKQKVSDTSEKSLMTWEEAIAFRDKVIE